MRGLAVGLIAARQVTDVLSLPRPNSIGTCWGIPVRVGTSFSTVGASAGLSPYPLLLRFLELLYRAVIVRDRGSQHLLLQ